MASQNDKNPLERNDLYKKTWKERKQIMREKTIEQKLVKAVGQLGGICPKLTCPGFDGMPDRLVLMPGGRMAFVEVKAPGRGLRPLQAARQRLLTHLGFTVYVLDNPGDIARVLDETGGKDEHEQD